MDARQLIIEKYRFQRFIGVSKLRTELKREKGHCTWCNGKCSRRWCSEACRLEGYVRAGWIEFPVQQRDKGVCAICSVDTLQIQRRVKAIYRRAKGNWDRDFKVYKTRPYTFARIRRFQRMTGYGPSRRPYDIDHIVPVSEGGGCCGLENLRTLCFKCHRTETAKLRKRLAKKELENG